jgi:hypothetical protein
VSLAEKPVPNRVRGQKRKKSILFKEGVKMRRFIIIAMTAVMLLSSIGVLSPVDEDIDVEAAPSRAIFRIFAGWIEGLNVSNPDGLPSTYGLNVSGMSPGPPPTPLPPDQATIALNATNPGNFSVIVDISLHDTTQPWTFTLDDCYGWNETNNGTVSYPHPVSWDNVHYIPNGTLGYYKGVFGNISIKILNGSSGQPLENVSFRFENHPDHSTIASGNMTDPSGDVRFNNMQLGLDRYNSQNNLVKVYITKENFTYNDGNGTDVAYLPLFLDATTQYTMTIDENPLVKNSAPSPEANTGINVDRNRVPNQVFVEFFDDIDQSTVDRDTLYLMEEGGGKVNITYQWATSKLCGIKPNEDLKYNTTYRVFVTPRITNTTGYPQLWRTFSFDFKTQLPPGVLRCQVNINGTMDPAPEGSMIKLDAGLPYPLVNGYYEFTDVFPSMSGHTITVIGPTVNGTEEYLYYGNTISDIDVDRGQVIDVLGLHVTKRPVRQAEITIVDEEEFPVFGATVIHKVTDETGTTDLTGKVTFEEILVERDTSFWISYPNYEDDSLTIQNGTMDPVMVTKTIFENKFPITMKARSDFEYELPGSIIPVDSKIQIDFETDQGVEYNMDPDTMTTDNLKILDDQELPIQIDIESTPGDGSRWSLIPRDFLEYGSNYTVLVTESVATTTGTNPLWRDYRLTFATESLDDSSVSGTVTVRGRGVGGVKIEVLQDGVVKATTVTTENGGYAVAVKHDDFTLMNISVRADGEDVGLSTKTFGPLNLNAGGSRESTDFDLTRLSDWFRVLYPADDEGRMPITGTFTLKFKVALDSNDMESFKENFTLRNPEIPIDVNVSDDGRTVTIDPREDLDYDKIYFLSVSADFQDEFFRELKDVNGTYALPRGEIIEVTTEFKPIEVILQTPSANILDRVSVDVPVTIFFTNYSINVSRMEELLQFKEVLSGSPVGNLTFSWTLEDQKVEIGHDRLKGSTEYSVSIASGKYGTGDDRGAMIRDDFLVTFTTEPVMIDVDVVSNWPQKVDSGAQTVVSLENPLGYGIRVVILVEEVRGSGNYIEYENLTLAAGETDRQVTLDTDELDKGDYQAMIKVYDSTKDPIVLLDEYPINLLIEEDKDNGSNNILWVFIVIGAIVILIAILAVFLISQSKKKDIEEELKEEFECPECHHLVSEDDAVCPHCGAEFEEQAYKCPKCSSMLDPEDEECPECGYDFSDQDQMELEDDDEDDIEEGEMEIEEDEEIDMDDEEMEEEEEED